MKYINLLYNFDQIINKWFLEINAFQKIIDNK